LQLDDRLAAHLAYDGFSYHAKLHVSLPSGLQVEFDREFAGGRAVADLALDSLVVSTAEHPITPPNAVRMDTDQPVPTLVEEKGQTVEKYVSYAGKDVLGRTNVPKERSAKVAPSNVVKGIET